MKTLFLKLLDAIFYVIFMTLYGIGSGFFYIGYGMRAFLGAADRKWFSFKKSQEAPKPSV